MGAYPSRVKWSHQPIVGVRGGRGVVAVRGRVVRWEGTYGVVADESGQLEISMGVHGGGIAAGDIVELTGEMQADKLIVHDLQILAAGRADWDVGDWLRFNRSDEILKERLRLRGAIFEAIRAFFSQGRFREVETPVLVAAAAPETHIDLFATTFKGEKSSMSLFLAPSPELYMKRLLGIGMERIYQLGRSFRNGEVSALHQPEFVMLEWYRAYASYEEIIEDVENLVAFVAERVLGAQSFVRQGRDIDLTPPWERISVYRAFLRWADIDLSVCTEADSLYRRASALELGSARPEDSWETLFHKILLDKVEPELAKIGAVHLVDYPSQLAALAKLKEDRPDLAERAEAYVAGVELSNGYTELNDPQEQRRRFVEEAKMGQAPLDEAFLMAMDQGFPPAGGVALGVDRLVLLLTGADHLDEVVAFPLGY